MRLSAAVLGFANLPLGLGNGMMLSAIPQLLAARHVAEPAIADVTASGLAPGFAIFLAGPLLDRGFSRRAYAVAATMASALAAAAATLLLAHPLALAVVVPVLSAAASLNLMAIGGWFGTMLPPSEEAALGTSMSVAFAVGFALASVAGVPLIRALPPPLAAVAVGTAILAPLPLYAALRAPPPATAGDTPARFARRVLALLGDRGLRRLIILFALPTGCFALTNTLSGLGADFHTPERLVGLLNGVAVTATGIGGALLVPPLVRRAAAWHCYLAAGAAGAGLTLLLAVLPRTPTTFALALVAENAAQAFTLTTVTVVALQSLDADKPLAATRFGLLTAVPQLPVAYMQWLDGQAYGVGGLRATILVDGGLSLLACLAASLLFRAGRAPAR